MENYSALKKAKNFQRYIMIWINLEEDMTLSLVSQSQDKQHMIPSDMTYF